MKILALIPARGGSKRCPGKNVATLDGRPLLAWTINTAHMSHIGLKKNRIIVSTDDEEIARCADAYGATVWERPRHLAGDDVPMLPVLKDVFENTDADIYVLLQPTSPFRTADDIDAAVKLLIERNADSVVSVTEAPLDWAYQVRHAGRLEMLPNIVRDNGAIYIITREALERGENWYSGQCYAYVMPKDRSLDIDTPLDLEIARAIVAKQKAA